MKRKKTTTIQQLTKWQSEFGPLTSRYIQYAESHCFDNDATTSKNNIMCTQCGHTWKVKNAEDITEVTCPHCKKKLTIVKRHSLRYKDTEYFCVALKKHGFQVIRYFQFRKNVRPGSVTYTFDEVGAKWINEKGTYYDFRLPRGFMPRFIDTWNFNGEIKYRKYANYYGSILSYCCPSATWTHSMIPLLKRNGWDGKALHYNIDDTIINLIKNPLFESYYKQRQYGLCMDINKNPNTMLREETWQRIVKICNRHGKKFINHKDWLDFTDYVKDLIYFNMDIYNPKFLLPEDFQKAHLDLSRKKAQKEHEERERRMREEFERRAQEQEEKSKWLKEYAVRYCDMLLKDGAMTIKPLVYREDFENEYLAMGHCIRTYYGKANALLISIEYNGNKAETAEIDLIHGEIIQCRGEHNKSSKWHKEIVSFVQRSMKEFVHRYNKKITLPQTLPAVIIKHKWEWAA